MDSLADKVNTNLLTLHLVETALNERAGWTVQFSSQVVPAQVIVNEHAITIWAALNYDLESDGDRRVFIAHAGTLLAVRVIQPQEPGPFEFELTLEPEQVTL